MTSLEKAFGRDAEGLRLNFKDSLYTGHAGMLSLGSG
jgi:hypothetical protein